MSISGYHIAEAGANPITQLAFTLSNALTYVEYYSARGMSIDDFAPNLSFFFSNGPEEKFCFLCGDFACFPLSNEKFCPRRIIQFVFAVQQ